MKQQNDWKMLKFKRFFVSLGSAETQTVKVRWKIKSSLQSEFFQEYFHQKLLKSDSE